MFIALLTRLALAQGMPTRQIPPSVLSELEELENKFEVALSADCNAALCFPKGCAYMDHSVADQPREGSLPGLGQDPGPGSVTPQEFLTRARCSFAHEQKVAPEDVQALMRRLQSKLSRGWLVVSIDHQELLPIPAGLQDPPKEPEVVEEAPPEPPPEPELSLAQAARELWTILLPHFSWMIAVVMVTVAGTILVWAWRRVGRESLEEKMMLSQLGRPTDEDQAQPEPAAPLTEDDHAFVARQVASWAHRLEAAVDNPDLELQALVRELLRSRDLPLLAKAVLKFPDSFLAAFPAGGDVAAAKLELADYVKSVSVDSLPSDLDFFRALERHARSAALSSQSDALIVRSLRDEFGATGLVALIGGVPARTGALLFALAPIEEQHEMVRLLSPRQTVSLAEQLLRSNRMPRSETAYLFRVLEAARSDEPLPQPPQGGEVSDRGAEFDAASALSVLLPNLAPEQRTTLFDHALARFHGSVPAWFRGIFVPEMLFALPDDGRADLLLELDVDTLAAWLSLVDAETRSSLLGALPDTLRAAVGAASVFSSRAHQLGLAERGRRDLARGFQRQLARENLSFEHVLHPETPGEA